MRNTLKIARSPDLDYGPATQLRRKVVSMRKVAALFLSVFVLLPMLLEAREAKYKDSSIEIGPDDRLVIIGFKGTVQLTGVPGGKGSSLILKARKSISDKAAAVALEAFESWSFSLRREDKVVRLEMTGPTSRTDWQSQLKSGFPEFTLEIQSPSVPTEIAWREGNVNITGWRSNASITAVDGAVKLAKNEGDIRVQLQKGEIALQNHKGRVEIDSHMARVAITHVEGDVNLENFSGDSNLQDAKGSLRLRSVSGATLVSKSSGSVDFENGRAGLSIQGFDGQIRGQTEEGPVSAQIEGETDVHIESVQGHVSLKLPPNSGAQVRLQTEDGQLTGPDSLSSARGAESKTLAGKLGGQVRGNVVVKTKSGNVRIR
jgi:hypothetical protein